MDKITQEAYFRQRYIEWSKWHSITETAIRYKLSRKTIYKWLKRYDGSLESLKDQSRRPHHMPNKQTEEEEKLVKRYVKRYRKDLLLAYQKAMEKGYSRSYGCFKRTAKKLGELPNKKRKVRKNKPYQRAEYPGQKIQMDVKFVPKECLVGSLGQCYQYTATDECTRWTFRWMYDEHSTYSSKDFLERLVQAAPFQIRLVQTDNGAEFTNSLIAVKSKHRTLFETALEEMGIQYKRIRIATPRHNGKVERQHRIDTERFYSKMRMFSLEDGRKQLAVYQAKSNHFIKTCLGMRSPLQVLDAYQGVM